MSHQCDYYLLDILSIGSWFARNNPCYEVYNAALATANVQHFTKTNVVYWICLGLPCTPACLPLSLPKRANKNKVVVFVCLSDRLLIVYTPHPEKKRGEFTEKWLRCGFYHQCTCSWQHFFSSSWSERLGSFSLYSLYKLAPQNISTTQEPFNVINLEFLKSGLTTTMLLLRFSPIMLWIPVLLKTKNIWSR